MHDASSAPRPNLAIPLGLLGAAGSYLVATSFVRNHGVSAFEVTAFALPTTASVCIGLWLSHRARGGRPVGWGGFFASLFLGGALAGAFIGLTAGRTEVGFGLPLFGAAFGFCMTILFVPVLSPAFLAWRQIGPARSPSVADGSVRQRLWSATALGLAVYAFGLLSWPVLDPPEGPRWVGIYLALIAIAMSAWGVASEVRRYIWLRRIAKGLVPGHGAPDDESTTLDLGVGDETWSADVPKPHPYRAAPFPVRTVRGSPSVVSTAVRTSLFIHAAALGVSLLVGSTIGA